MYQQALPNLAPKLATVVDGTLRPPPMMDGRLILKGGRVVDPANGVDRVADLALLDGSVQQLADGIAPEKGDAVLNCEGLMVWPGLLDMHLHINDLFEVSTNPALCAAQDGVTTGLSPGAGNTFLAPALLGAEVDRGMPLNVGLFLGAAALLACGLGNDSLVALFEGRLPAEEAQQGLTRNAIANATAPLVVGIKEHMGHYIPGDEDVERLFDVASRANLLLMSHTQDPEHTRRLLGLAKGRPLHLGHALAAGCWHDGVESLRQVIDFCRLDHVSGEFVTSMLRRGGGNREGLVLPPAARQLALDALAEGLVDILVSDGQAQATMKGFGDTRDNIPAILELAQEGVLPLPAAVATMTSNPARLLAQRSANPWWSEKLGHLGAGARANATVVNPATGTAVYTLVNGRAVAFEGRLVRRGYGAGHWVCAKGEVPRVGAGDIPMYEVKGR